MSAQKNLKIKKQKTNGLGARRSRLAPPPYMVQEVRSWTLRYITTAPLAAIALTAVNLGSMLGFVATSATTSAFLSSVVKVKRITLWAPVATAGTSVQAVIDWNSTAALFVSPGSASEDSSVSFDRPAHLDCVPPKESLSRMWQSVLSTDALVTLTAPTGTIIDFTLNWVINDNGGPVPGPVIIGGTIGQIFHSIVGSLSPVYLNSI